MQTSLELPHIGSTMTKSTFRCRPVFNEHERPCKLSFDWLTLILQYVEMKLKKEGAFNYTSITKAKNTENKI